MVKEDPFSEVKEHFSTIEDVVVASGSGAQGIKFNKKMFVMFYKGGLIVKLSPKRVSELVEKGEALAYDPGTGKPMKDRVLVPMTDQEKWTQFAIESMDYVMS